jgi:outer membrane biosynthesis protein TonB
MNDSLIPDRGPGGNKTVLFLLAGGTILMAAAGLVIYLRSTPPPPPEPKPETPAAVKTLVVPTHPKPLIAEVDTAAPDTDTGKEDTETKKDVKKRAGGPTGTIDTKAVNSYIKTNFSQVKACYERRLKTNSLLEGKLDLNIVISTSGKVAAVTVNSDSVRDAEMLACVKTTIRAWEFPKPEGGKVIIAKTFNFKKKDR